jgi:hypothetical protein
MQVETNNNENLDTHARPRRSDVVVEFNEVDEDAFHEDKPLILGSTDAVNAKEIIQQIDQVNMQKLTALQNWI